VQSDKGVRWPTSIRTRSASCGANEVQAAADARLRYTAIDVPHGRAASASARFVFGCRMARTQIQSTDAVRRRVEPLQRSIF